MRSMPSSSAASSSPASRTCRSLSLRRHWGEACGRCWIHRQPRRGDVARVLVMDDDELLRGALRVVLEGAGYEVIESGDGHAGLQLHREQAPGVVPADIVTPV